MSSTGAPWPPQQQPLPYWQGAAPPGGQPAPTRNRWKWILGTVIALMLIIAVVLAVVFFRKESVKAVPEFGEPREILSDLNMPRAVAVDGAGDIYVADAGNHRVVKYTGGDTTGTVLPFDEDSFPIGLAVDPDGTVYVLEPGEVFKLESGASEPTELPFGKLGRGGSLAVDRDGNVYVSHDSRDGTGQVLKLVPDAPYPTEISIPGLETPEGIALDDDGNLFVVDFDGHTVFKLEPGQTQPVRLPLGDRSWLHAITVDSSGTVYVTQTDLDGDDPTGHVFALPAGADAVTELPVPGLQWAEAIALDSAGNLYVTDGNPDNNTGSLLKLPVR